jgi:transcriptional regulator with XRE-family HTH domain
MPRLRTTPEAKAFGVFLGRVLRAARRSRGIKAHSLAEDVGTTQQAVSFWETGKTVPEMRNLFSACRVIGVPVWRVIARAERAYEMDRTMKRDAAKHERIEE